MINKETIEYAIEETETEIKNKQIVIQGLNEVKDKAREYDDKSKIQQLINNLNNEIDFLEDIKNDDKQALINNGLV